MRIVSDKDLYDYALYDELPADWQYLYIGNKYNENSCLFCQKGVVRKQYKVLGHKNWYFYVCNSCDKKMVDIKNKIDESKRNIDKKMSKLEDFKITGRFPESAVDLAFMNKNECVFCGKDDFGMLEIQAPQDQFNIVLKPNKVCRKCKDKIPQNLKSVPKDRCALCLKEYYISNSEWKMRVDLGTVSEHICNQCLCMSGLETETIDGNVKCPACGKKHKHNLSLVNKRFTEEDCGCKEREKKTYALPLTVEVPSQIKIPFREGYGERKTNQGEDNIITIVNGFMLEDELGIFHIFSVLKSVYNNDKVFKIDVYRVEHDRVGKEKISFKGETLFTTKVYSGSELISYESVDIIYKKISELTKTILTYGSS